MRNPTRIVASWLFALALVTPSLGACVCNDTLGMDPCAAGSHCGSASNAGVDHHGNSAPTRSEAPDCDHADSCDC